jgi:hypothetical protein
LWRASAAAIKSTRAPRSRLKERPSRRVISGHHPRAVRSKKNRDCEKNVFDGFLKRSFLISTLHA